MQNKRASSKGDAQVLASLEAGEWRSRLTPERRKELKHAAEATLRRDSRVNLRLSSRDLELLKVQAVREGLPYQTYLASVLHKVATGQYATEKSSSK